MLSRLQYIKINIGYGLTSRILALILEFISRYYFIKFLGNEILGITNVFVNILQVLSLAELGLNNVAMYSYYKPLAQQDFKKLSALNTFFEAIYNRIAFVILFFGLVILPFIHLIINLEHSNYNIYWMFFLFLLDSVFSYFFIYKTIILSAAQKSYIISLYDMVCNTVRTILQIFVLIEFKSFTLFFILKIIFTVISNVLKVRKVNLEFPNLKKSKVQISKSEKSEIISTLKSGLVYKLSGVLLNGTDNIIISTIVGTIYVGFLSNYTIIATSIMSFVVIIFSSMTSSVGNILHTEDRSVLLRSFEKIQSIANWLSIVLFLCLYFLSSDFIKLWLGETFVMSNDIVLFSSLTYYISCFLQPIYIYREATGLFTKTKYVMLITAILNIILSFIFGYYMGVAGVLLASIVSRLLTYFWYEPLVLFKDIFSSSSIRYFIEVFKNMSMASILIVVINFIPFKVDSWWDWTYKGGIIFFISNICSFTLYRNTLGINFAMLRRVIKGKLKG
ncbi:TPA: lipopolysaccharide biosynthesis protein [Streptococcus suis]